MDDDRITLHATLAIPMSEIIFRFIRSSGPGGQHVNTSATRVELLFDVKQSPSLNDTERQRLLISLRNLIDQKGVLHLESQSTRSQLQNRRDVIQRFQTLLRQALKPRRTRKATRPTAAARKARLNAKKRRGALKRSRQDQFADE